MNEGMTTVLIAVLLLVVVLFRKKGYLREGKQFQADEEHLILIEDSIQYLKQKLGAPRKRYIMPDQIIGMLKNDPMSDYGLQLLLQDIARHCNYHRRSLQLHLYNKAENVPPGRITNRDGIYVIELHMDADIKDTNKIISVLMHEFCHFYLMTQGLGFSVTNRNEILTDTATVFLGFGEWIRYGYRPTMHGAQGGNSWNWVGYINVREIEYAMKICTGD